MSHKKVELGVNIVGNAEEKMEHLKHQAEQLHGSIEKINGIGAGLLGAFGLGAGIFEVMDLVKESIGEYRELMVVQTNISMLLKNVPHDIELSAKAIENSSKEIAESLGVPLGKVEKVAAALINIDKIAGNKELYERVFKLSYDFGAAKGMDATESAKLISKLIMNPARAVGLLTAAGVNDPGLTKAIKGAVKLGHAGEASAVILDLLTAKYKGMAEALHKADPFSPLEDSLTALKEALGPLATQVAVKLMPTVIDLTKKLTEWLSSIKPEQVDEFISAIKLATEFLLALAGLNLVKNIASTVGFFITPLIEKIGSAMALNSAVSGGIAGAEGAAAGAGGALIATAGGVALAVSIIAMAPWIMDKMSWFSHGGKEGEEKKNKESIQENQNWLAAILESNMAFKESKTDIANGLFDYIKGYDLDVKVDIDDIKTAMEEYSKHGDNIVTELKNYIQKNGMPDQDHMNKFLHFYEDLDGAKKGEQSSSDYLKALKNLNAFEKKYTDLKVTGSSNKQFIININGGIGNDMENVFPDAGQEAAPRIERTIIDSILKTLNALPAYTK